MRVLLFSDDYGTPLTLRHLPAGHLVAIVGAASRPEYHRLLIAQASASRVPFLVQPRHSELEYEEFLRATRALRPELLLVNSYSMRLPEDLLAASSQGGVNVHGALLPRYRGANPIQWALINNETETGVTVHRLTPKLDAGAVIAERRVPISLTDTWREIQARIAAATDDLLCEVMPRLLKGHLEGIPQDERHARDHRRRTPEDGKIDWRQSVLRIYNLVRALVQPHPGAFYEIAGVPHVLDTYKSIAEITTMKARLGSLCLTHEGTTITPMTKHALPLDGVWFELGVGSQRDSHCMLGLCDIDYRTRSARLEAECIRVAPSVLTAAATLVERYAAEELELACLNVGHSTVNLNADGSSAELARHLAHADSRPTGSPLSVTRR